MSLILVCVLPSSTTSRSAPSFFHQSAASYRNWFLVDCFTISATNKKGRSQKTGETLIRRFFRLDGSPPGGGAPSPNASTRALVLHPFGKQFDWNASLQNFIVSCWVNRFSRPSCCYVERALVVLKHVDHCYFPFCRLHKTKVRLDRGAAVPRFSLTLSRAGKKEIAVNTCKLRTSSKYIGNCMMMHLIRILDLDGSCE